MAGRRRGKAAETNEETIEVKKEDVKQEIKAEFVEMYKGGKTYKVQAQDVDKCLAAGMTKAK